MKKLSLLLSVLLSSILLYMNAFALANPASVKCVNDGGRLVMTNGINGQYGECILPGGVVCEEWSYYRGTCPTAQGVCSQEVRLCPDGLPTPREPNCTWRPDLCQTITCTSEYAPVCGQPPMPYCPPGLSCIQAFPPIQTYTNICYLRSAQASFLYSGACDGRNCGGEVKYCQNGTVMPRDANCTWRSDLCPATQVCTTELRYCADGSPMPRDQNCTWRSDLCPACSTQYNPICARPPCSGTWCPSEQTYQNLCQANMANATVLYYGSCTTTPKACTEEARYCEDGSLMKRDADCTWRGDLCSTLDYFSFAYAHGLTTLPNRIVFRPNDAISRQEATKVLDATVQLLNNGNTITPIVNCTNSFRDSYQFDFTLSPTIYRVCGLGLMRGDGTYFRPYSALSRYEMRLVLTRLLDLTGYGYLKARIDTSNPNVPITRKDMILWVQDLYTAR